MRGCWRLEEKVNIWEYVIEKLADLSFGVSSFSRFGIGFRWQPFDALGRDYALFCGCVLSHEIRVRGCLFRS